MCDIVEVTVQGPHCLEKMWDVVYAGQTIERCQRKKHAVAVKARLDKLLEKL